MPAINAPPRALLTRALADEVATLIGSWRRTTLSMLLGALILCIVLREYIAPPGHGALDRRDPRQPGVAGCAGPLLSPGESPARGRRALGNALALGSTIAGTLWGIAAVAFYPDSAAHQALIIVSLFGVALGGLNLTAVYKPAFYGFVLPAVLP